MWFICSYPSIIWWGEFPYGMCTLTQSQWLIFLHPLPREQLLSKSTQGQTEQMLLLAAANSYRTSASLPYFFCESELKGAQTSCSRHLSDLDLTVANLPSFMNLPLNASLTTDYNNDKTEPGASMFCSPCPERNLRTDSSENPEYTKYILKSAKSTSGDEIRSSIHTSLALLPVCEL